MLRSNVCQKCDIKPQQEEALFFFSEDIEMKLATMLLVSSLACLGSKL